MVKRYLALAGLCALAAAGWLVPAASAAVSQPVVVSPVPARVTPQVLDGRVQAIVQVGDLVVVGGKFTQVRLPKGPVLARKNLFAFDALTGQISTSFVPLVAGGSVFTLQPGADGASVIVGGKFTSIDGAAANGLARLRLGDGSVDAGFAPRIRHGAVLDSVLSGGHLFVAGSFTRAGGAPRTGLVELDAATGALDPAFDFTLADPLFGQLQASHLAVSPDGRTLIVAGTFTAVQSQRRVQIAMIDIGADPAALSDWSTPVFDPIYAQSLFQIPCMEDAGGNVRSIDFSPDGSYFVLGTTGGGSAFCDSVVRFETGAAGAGQLPTWADHTGGDSITDVAVTGTAIYAGGHQRFMEHSFGGGSIPREGIAALDPANGMPFSWDPGRRPRGTGVYAFLATSTGLWIGGDSTYTAGKYHPRLAFFPTAGGTAVPPVSVPDLPGKLGSISSAGVATSDFDGTTAGTIDVLPTPAPLLAAGGTFMIDGTLYAFTTDGRLVFAAFDGQAIGPVQSLDLYGNTFDIANVNGAFYDPAQGRLYFTVQGDPTLYARFFEPQSGLLQAQTVAVGQLPAPVSALTRVGANLVFVDQQGNLDSVSWQNGVVGSAITQLSGPAVDGRDWTGTTGLFISPN